MPKVVKQEGDDPDPTPYLFVSLEQKRIDQTKPYDAKKSCWVPDDKEGFILGEIKGTKGDLVTVGISAGEVLYQNQIHQYCTRGNKQIKYWQQKNINKKAKKKSKITFRAFGKPENYSKFIQNQRENY